MGYSLPGFSTVVRLGGGWRVWMDGGAVPHGAWLQLHSGGGRGRAALSAILHRCQHPAWRDLLLGQAGPCLRRDTGGDSGGGADCKAS